MYYLVRLQHHHVTEEFGTVSCDDPYDHYIGDTVERTNLRYTIVNNKALDELLDVYIPDNPFDYESVVIMCEFPYEHEVKRFVKCMKMMDLLVADV
jgi:hypothetical protein